MAIDIDFILAKLTLDASNAETKMRSMMAWCQQGPSRLAIDWLFGKHQRDALLGDQMGQDLPLKESTKAPRQQKKFMATRSPRAT
ncbi:MAG: hypothetical protein EBX55_00475 [Betaproteobacteria bacterium]|nr:hypothetical protein [Betaproteobacteria bacterium]NBQ96132.1 hypothetical protein [Betaproteobacteria bacterium]NBS40262.1 hypothetical protein [Betaproteobacteria bacterium]NCV13942.1 hypothetical protein [Betaproteobacteria bacterium]NDG56944.1 hypothetical protein [Betaproteobacteria bacterium]